MGQNFTFHLLLSEVLAQGLAGFFFSLPKINFSGNLGLFFLDLSLTGEISVNNNRFCLAFCFEILNRPQLWIVLCTGQLSDEPMLLLVALINRIMNSTIQPGSTVGQIFNRWVSLGVPPLPGTNELD